MDIKALLIWVSNHVDQVFGTTLVLFFITSIILLIRSIGEKNKTDGAPSTIDVRDIEGAMKRVLATQTVSVAAAPADGSAAVPVSGVDANAAALAAAAAAAALAQRESKIEELSKELAVAKVAMENAAAAGGASTQSTAELDALKAKLEEAQARLAEYEIIEDDIADLSLFKEENARLKTELSKLKTTAPSAAAPTVEPPPATAATAKVSAPEAAASLGAIPEAKPASEKFELDPNDDLMKEFASAVEIQRAPPPEASVAVESALDEMLDTDKMLSEVASLNALAEGDASSALEETLDTDKLLAEAGSFSAQAPQSTAAAPAAPKPEAAPKKAAPAAAPVAESDDLLAEFMDSKSES